MTGEIEAIRGMLLALGIDAAIASVERPDGSVVAGLLVDERAFPALQRLIVAATMRQ